MLGGVFWSFFMGWGLVDVLGRDGQTDVDVETAVVGREGEVGGAGAEGCDVVVDFGDGGGGVGEDARDELEWVRVPIIDHVRSFELVGGRFVGESLRQVLLVDPHEASLVSQVPAGEVRCVFVAVEGVVDFDAVREQSLGYVEDFAAVGPVAVLGEMQVELLLEADVVALGRVVGRCCEGPAHVSLAGDVAVAYILV